MIDPKQLPKQNRIFHRLKGHFNKISDKKTPKFRNSPSQAGRVMLVLK